MKRQKWHKVPHEVNPEWGLNHYDLQTLATYNAECERGIIHTVVLDDDETGRSGRLLAGPYPEQRARDICYGYRMALNDSAHFIPSGR